MSEAESRPGSLPSAAAEAKARLAAAREEGLDLDLTRGKPAPEQLDLSSGLLERVATIGAESGSVDPRNYGLLEGLPEARGLFADYLEVEPNEVWVQGNSSLRLMFDCVLWCCALNTSTGPSWRSQGGPVRFLCPTPGYDRHFHLLEHFGIEMIPVPINDEGPDLEEVTRSVAEDASIKGMFCVPRFSNPTGAVYSDEVVRSLASMPTAATDFRIFWDNAYARHALNDRAKRLESLLSACKSSGHPERALVFGSTSKVTLAGAGLSLLAVAGRNQEWLRSHLSKQSIGPNKVIQRAHVEFFSDISGIDQHMERHAQILRPKFERALDVLQERLAGLGVATWTEPDGGYFLCVWTPKDCAARTVALAEEVGVRLTPAGATSPGGVDPDDSVLRLAPSFPSIDQVGRCTEVLSDCILVASAERAS